MSETITWRDATQATVTWGGAVASAWTEGAKQYALEAQKELVASGQTVLTETRKIEIFATEQAKQFRTLGAMPGIVPNGEIPANCEKSASDYAALAPAMAANWR